MWRIFGGSHGFQSERRGSPIEFNEGYYGKLTANINCLLGGDHFRTSIGNISRKD